MKELCDFILYTIGVNRTIEKTDLSVLFQAKFPYASEGVVDAILLYLVQSGKVSTFGTTLFLPTPPEADMPEDAPNTITPKLLISGGAILLGVALFMDASVPVHGLGVRVYNAGLMNTRIVMAICGAGFLLGGIVSGRKS